MTASVVQGDGVGFSDSHLGQLRALVGHMPITVPGAQVVVQDRDGRLLLQRRTDDGTWETPAGSCEPGQSFARTAVTELAEEAGIVVEETALVPFACLSDPDIHTMRYPNGDVVLAYSLCFLVSGVDAATTELRPDPAESTEVDWFDRTSLPAPIREATQVVLQLLDAYRESGQFQAR